MMRRYGMELMGTFFVMLAITFTGNPLAIGLMYMAMIYVGSHISGAHFNPAVSTAMLIRGRLTLNDYLGYVLAQILGAFVAAALFYGISGSPFSLELPAGINFVTAMVPEFLLTFVLCLVFLTVMTSSHFRDIHFHGIVPGLTLVAIAFVGGLFNPAVVLGGLVFSMVVGSMGNLVNSLLVHVLAPLLGGLVAAYKFKWLNPSAPQGYDQPRMM